MARTYDVANRMVSLSNGEELQEWKVERLEDDTYEYHAYVGHNYSKPNRVVRSKGAIWMLMRLANPGSTLETMEFRMGHTGQPGSGDDVLQTEWDNRATSTYYRWDEILPTFF